MTRGECMSTSRMITPGRASRDIGIRCWRRMRSQYGHPSMLTRTRIGVRDFYKAQEYMMAFLAPPPEDDPEGNVEGSQ